jgi:hypothetical protein
VGRQQPEEPPSWWPLPGHKEVASHGGWRDWIPSLHNLCVLLGFLRVHNCAFSLFGPSSDNLWSTPIGRATLHKRDKELGAWQKLIGDPNAHRKEVADLTVIGS